MYRSLERELEGVREAEQELDSDRRKRARQDDEVVIRELTNRQKTALKKSDIKCDRLHNLTYHDNLNAINSNDQINRNPYYYHELLPESNNKYNWFRALRSWRFGYKKQRGYESLELYWEIQCGNCGNLYLTGSSEEFIGKCCNPIEKAMNDPERYDYPKLEALTPYLRSLTSDKEFCHSSHCYNNRLAFGATGVENDEGIQKYLLISYL